MNFDIISGISNILAVTALGATIIVAFTRLIQEYRSRGTRGETDEINTRIQSLTSALSSSTELISEIEKEITERQQLVQKLENDVKTYNALAGMKQSEVEAIAQTLRIELDQQGRKSFWQQAGLNAFFFILGAVFSVVVSLFRG